MSQCIVVTLADPRADHEAVAEAIYQYLERMNIEASCDVEEVE
jgi:hypothetical protein